MSGTAHRVIELHAGGRCELSCATCDCRTRPSDRAWALKVARDGGARITCRGGTSGGNLAPILEAAVASFDARIVRTPAIELVDPERVARLLELGVTGVLVPLSSHVPAVHDRLAGLPGALARTLAGLRAAAAAGLTVEVEIPLLPARLQDLPALVGLAHRAVPTLRAVRFFVPRWSLPEALVAPPWDEGAGRLAEALEKARALGLRVEPAMSDALPLCALREHRASLRLFRGRGTRAPGCSEVEACRSCAVADRCAGVAESYRALHGERGLVPYARRPAELEDRAPNPHAGWTQRRVEKARSARMLVLRPTVNCNQDCTFCSANETSGNVWTAPEEMLRAIARAGRRGVKWLSFSGGEPTLSKDLVSYVRTASRSGIENVELITNGVLLDRLDKVEALRRAGLTHAFVSLHAHDEELSRRMTQKVGDFPRTVAAVGNLLDSFVAVTLNHVITARNFRYLSRFVEFAHARWQGRAWISFAFVTPQYKALENLELVPRLSDVMPHLRRAMHRAMALGQPVTIGVRQGIPPCFLGEFQAWSDLFQRASESAAEDAPQKQQGPACETCRYQAVCPGLWKPYVQRYGTGELRPVPGPAVDLARFSEGRQALFSFGDVPEELRDREAERRGLEELSRPEAVDTVPLPLFDPVRTRPLRLALFGSGPRARLLAHALRGLEGVSLDAVASPHAPDGDLAEFGHCPAFRDPAEALEAMRPEGVVIASAAPTHAALAKLALGSAVPVLVERPLASTLEEAELLARLAAEGRAALVTMDALAFAPGIERVVQASGRLVVQRRMPPHGPRTPRAWGRAAFATLLHDLAGVLPGPRDGAPVEVAVRGASRPERVRIEWASAVHTISLLLDFDAPVDELVLQRTELPEQLEWRTSAEVAFDPGPVLRHFREVVLGRAAVRTGAVEGLAAVRLVARLMGALEDAGVPFDRPQAPTHVASRLFRELLP